MTTQAPTPHPTYNEEHTERWYAVRTRAPQDLASAMSALDGFMPFVPMQSVRQLWHGRKLVVNKPYINNVLFVRCSARGLKAQELRSRRDDEPLPLFHVYRKACSEQFEAIPDWEIHLMRLLTTGDAQACEVFRGAVPQTGRKLRVVAGMFAGYEGRARQIRHDRRIIISIEGRSMVALPTLHPDLVTLLPNDTAEADS